MRRSALASTPLVVILAACGWFPAMDPFDVRECGLMSSAEIDWSGKARLDELGLPLNDAPPHVPRDKPVDVHVSIPDQGGARVYCVVIDGTVAHTGLSEAGWDPPAD